jgi:pyruvate-formate lyase
MIDLLYKPQQLTEAAVRLVYLGSVRSLQSSSMSSMTMVRVGAICLPYLDSVAETND